MAARRDRLRRLEAELAHTRMLLHEADHRAKNSLQIVASLVLLQARRAGATPDPRRLYAIAERISALSIVHRLLAEHPEGRFDVAAFLRASANEAGGGRTGIALEAQLRPAVIAPGRAPSLALLLHELVANAYQHAFPDGAPGRVRIEAGIEPEGLRIVVADDGVGCPAEPPEGFGLMLVDLLGRQLRAAVSREPAAPGTRVTVLVPADG
jgi:two-component sensor histidine kinase